jgi:hypothetical protein
MFSGVMHVVEIWSFYEGKGGELLSLEIFGVHMLWILLHIEKASSFDCRHDIIKT